MADRAIGGDHGQIFAQFVDVVLAADHDDQAPGGLCRRDVDRGLGVGVALVRDRSEGQGGSARATRCNPDGEGTVSRRGEGV